MSALSFGDWHPLTNEGLKAADDAPGAVQLSRADRSLVEYPKGKSAMVFYFYAARSMREALRRLFHDELETPGSRGEGVLAFRTLTGGSDVQAWAEGRYDDFVQSMGAPPILHADDDDE
ncbi:MAG: hypothetical protein Q8O67_11415 [Deltaproteobacteria bacterium]|nr:hypothetical protein [Deltaproteobacteria bacterium]